MNDMANRISTRSAGLGRLDLTTWLAAFFSIRRPELGRGGNLFVAALVLRLAGAGLLAWVGYIHWHLWSIGYKEIATVGPLFLVDGIAGILLAAVLLGWPRPLIGLLSAGFIAATIVPLVISLTIGLLGFHESIQAAYVVQALVLECIAVLVLAAWTVIAAGAVVRNR
jgi:hypothetical protein